MPKEKLAHEWTIQEEVAPSLLLLIEGNKKVELNCWSRKRVSLSASTFAATISATSAKLHQRP